MSRQRDVVVVGCGGMGRETADLLDAIFRDSGQSRAVGYVDDAAATLPSEVGGLPVLGELRWLEGRQIPAAVAVGSPQLRRSLVDRLKAIGCVEFPTLIHPGALVGGRVSVGEGSLVLAGAVLTTDIAIGRFAIINVGASISHDCVAEDFATLGPGARLAGSTVLETGAEVGIGAVTRQGCRIGAWAVVGAGAVVLGPVESKAVVAGVPARPLRGGTAHSPGRLKVEERKRSR